MKRWHFVAIGVLVGVTTSCLALYFLSRPVVEMFSYAPLVSAASDGALDVEVLRKLRSNDVAGAIELMEHRLSINEATIDAYARSTDLAKQGASVTAANARIREYRREHPSPVPPNTSLERTRDR